MYIYTYIHEYICTFSSTKMIDITGVGNIDILVGNRSLFICIDIYSHIRMTCVAYHQADLQDTGGVGDKFFFPHVLTCISLFICIDKYIDTFFNATFMYIYIFRIQYLHIFRTLYFLYSNAIFMYMFCYTTGQDERTLEGRILIQLDVFIDV